ncbi:MAG TPA: PAS domain S-box protein [Terriglobales bacterium]|nr:PAS domain S-box protein [Terriglobales bacterium]
MKDLSAIERWEVSYQITALLAESADPQRTVYGVLSLVGTAMDFDAGSFWVLHEERAVLRAASFWTKPGLLFPNFELVTRVREMTMGQGLPGKVWETQDLVWYPELAKAANFPRALVAAMDGIHLGVAFPAKRMRHVFGVFEFFSRERWECDLECRRFLAALGVQIAVFLEYYRIKDSVVEEDDKVRLAADRSLDAVLTIDKTSKILYANSAVRQLFGWAPQELIGGQLTKVIPEYLRHVHEEGIRRYNETGVRHLDWNEIRVPGLHKEGHEVPLVLAFGEFWRAGERVFTGFARKQS